MASFSIRSGVAVGSAFALAGLAALVSCTGDDTATPAVDAGPDAFGTDATVADASDASPPGDAADGGSADGDSNVEDASDALAPPAAPRLVVPGTQLIVEGITDDGWIIYCDNAPTPIVHAVFIGGGAPVALAPVGAVKIVGNVVWVRPSILTQETAVFSGATGVHKILVGSDAFAATSDNARVVVDVGGNGTYDFVEANVDLTNQKHIITSQCADVISVGTAFVTWSCFTDPHAEVWDEGGNKVPLDIADDTEIDGVAFDHGNRVFVSARSPDAGYTVQALPLDGGAPASFAAGLAFKLKGDIAVTPDGTRLVYASGDVFTTPTSSPSNSLLSGTPAGLYTFSADGKWMTVNLLFPGQGPYTLASTTAGGSFFDNDGGTAFIGFTDDSAYAVVRLGNNGPNALIVSLSNFSDVASASVLTAQAAGGSRFAFVGDGIGDAGSDAQVLGVVNASSPDAATAIAPADTRFAVNHAKDGAVFSTSVGNAPGIYYVALP